MFQVGEHRSVKPCKAKQKRASHHISKVFLPFVVTLNVILKKLTERLRRVFSIIRGK